MSNVEVVPVIQFYSDVSGKSLDDGFVYIGTSGIDPVTNPISVFWDEALTIPAPNPVRTRNGHPDRSGAPARFFVNADSYSFAVKNKNGTTVYTALDSLSASDVERRLRNATDPAKGAGMVGFNDGTVDGALTGVVPVGPQTERVDQLSLAVESGPFIARPLSTTARIEIFIDPAVGNDSNPGTQAQPLATINAALQLIPSAVYHKARIYLLDGDYTGQEFKLFNYFVSARSSAGLKIIGHVASVDGEAHPVYVDTNPSAVLIDGEHVISGVRGTEELTIAGVKFLNSWVEVYDSYLILDNCLFDTGYNIPGFVPKICLGGHNGKIKAVTSTFENCNAVIDAEGHLEAIFENCTAVNIVLGAESGLVFGYPVNARNSSRVYIKNSPTFNQTWPGGRNKSDNGSEIFDHIYSDVGNINYIWRGNAAADESVIIQGGNGTNIGQERGAGAAYYGRNHATLPGYGIQEFGISTNARFIVRFKGTGVSRDCLQVRPFGDIKVLGAVAFATNGETAGLLLNDEEAMIYRVSNGDCYIASKEAGQVRVARIFEYATATPI